VFFLAPLFCFLIVSCLLLEFKGGIKLSEKGK